MVNHDATNGGIITFRDLVRELWSIAQYLIRRWYVILAGMLVIGGAFFLYARADTPVYQAVLTFSVRESEGGGGGGGGVLAQLGLGSKSTSTAGINLDRLRGLTASRAILRRVLLRKVTLEGDEDFIANHLIDIYELREESWAESPMLMNFPGFQTDSVDQSDLTQNIVLRQLGSILIRGNDPVVSFVFDPISTIHSIVASTPSEELSLVLANVLYNELDQLYVNNSIDQQLQTVNTLQFRADSLGTRLEELEYQLAVRQDRSRGIVLRTADVAFKKLEREVRVANTMYGEVLKNLNAARFTLDNITPSFQVIDPPILPLQRKSLPVAFITFLGAMVGLILTVTVLVLVRATRKALQTV